MNHLSETTLATVKFLLARLEDQKDHIVELVKNTELEFGRKKELIDSADGQFSNLIKQILTLLNDDLGTDKT